MENARRAVPSSPEGEGEAGRGAWAAAVVAAAKTASAAPREAGRGAMRWLMELLPPVVSHHHDERSRRPLGGRGGRGLPDRLGQSFRSEQRGRADEADLGLAACEVTLGGVDGSVGGSGGDGGRD